MQTYDVYKLLGDIKADQERILSLLQDTLKLNAQERIYDLIELEKILHVSKRTLATWKKEGILPFTQVGAKIWVTETQLKSFLENHGNQTD